VLHCRRVFISGSRSRRLRDDALDRRRAKPYSRP
jgi:hypothetical protein